VVSRRELSILFRTSSSFVSLLLSCPVLLFTVECRLAPVVPGPMPPPTTTSESKSDVAETALSGQISIRTDSDGGWEVIIASSSSPRTYDETESLDHSEVDTTATLAQFYDKATRTTTDRDDRTVMSDKKRGKQRAME
jgi:hypothetical protein